MHFVTIVRALLISSMMAMVFFVHTGTVGADEPWASSATLAGEASVPYGWLDFCRRQPQDCNQPVLPAVDVNLTSGTWQTLNTINRRVNRTIEPVSNFEHWGTMLDHWDYPTDGKGDCKIFALYKRKLLIEAGLPRQALLMTIVRDLNGDGHTVLTIKTTKGEFVLDNLRDEIRPWDATGYHFSKRQSQENPNKWLAIAEPKARVSSLH
ncbi:MAG: transglutaminase-like cysteine peptidase [Beijerinckiaceae bacterium]